MPRAGVAFSAALLCYCANLAACLRVEAQEVGPRLLPPINAADYTIPNAAVPPGQITLVGGQGPVYGTGPYEAQPACACPSNLCPADCVGCWRDNVEISIVGDGFRDLGDIIAVAGPGPIPGQANFGLRTAINSAFSLGDWRTRGQIGASLGVFNLQGRDPWLSGNTDAQSQAFFTLGIYERSDVSHGDRVACGLVYDQFSADNWGFRAQDVSIGQLRGVLSWATSDCNALGAVCTVGILKDDTVFARNGIGAGAFGVECMDYVKLFWEHHFAFGGETNLFFGICDSSQVSNWMFGFQGRAPLSQNAALTCGFTYVVPDVPAGATGWAGNAGETWNLSAGVVFYLGGKAAAHDISGQQGLPLLDVADNGSLMVTR